MIYRSNLSAPDLIQHFHYTVSGPMPHSCGHDVIRDFAGKPDNDPVFGVYKNCGFWTHDEAAILYNTASSVHGLWLDIGGLTGWTAAHLAHAGCQVTSIDPMYGNKEFAERASANLRASGCRNAVHLIPCTSHAFFSCSFSIYSGVVIDGDHDGDTPCLDAIGASKCSSIIFLHDTVLQPVQRAVSYLRDLGWSWKQYRTPHGVALFWRPGLSFVPVEHVPDPALGG